MAQQHRQVRAILDHRDLICAHQGAAAQETPITIQVEPGAQAVQPVTLTGEVAWM